MVIWRAVTAGYAGLLTLVSVLPISVPETPGIPLDKAVHVCEYLVFAWCLVQLSRASRWAEETTLIVAFGLPIIWGNILEGVQMLLPYRSGDWLDVGANMAGSLLGGWLGLWFPAPPRSDT